MGVKWVRFTYAVPTAHCAFNLGQVDTVFHQLLLHDHLSGLH
jgi:hypothetical protein